MAGVTGKISSFQKRQKNLPKLIIQNKRVDLTRDAERGNLRSLKAAVQKALAHSEAFLLAGDVTDVSKGGELPIARCWAVVRAAVGGHTDVIRYFVENFSDIVSSGTQEACLTGKAPATPSRLLRTGHSRGPSVPPTQPAADSSSLGSLHRERGRDQDFAWGRCVGGLE